MKLDGQALEVDRKVWGGWWQVSEHNRVQAFKTDKQKKLFSFSLKHTFVALNHMFYHTYSASMLIFQPILNFLPKGEGK